MKKVLLSCAAVCMLFGACKKGEDSKSRLEILETGGWMLTAQKSTVTTGGVSFPESDDYANLDACERDNLTMFRSDMHFIIDEGATKCSSTAPQQNDNGMWTLTENDTKITITDGTDLLTGNIEQLDDNTLKLKITGSFNSSGVIYTYVLNTTYVHK